MEYDALGQPHVAIHWHNNLLKSAESLLGLCPGLIADNELNEAEIGYLDAWLQEHRELADTWPGDVIACRLRAILADGIITRDEAEDLKETLPVAISIMVSCQGHLHDYR